ncbi:MAG TPA: tetratricopeptide repeat protein [Humisphaera sp.]|nr:tetratricopeptide repeat protein [Humisphaera sp.]
MTIDQAYNLARQQYDSAQRARAEQICREILAQQPNHPTTLHLLGIMTAQAGQIAPAIELLRKAIAAQPNFYHALNDLAGALEIIGQRDEALTIYQTALRLQPNNPIAHYNLGHCLQSFRRDAEAIAEFRAALTLQPDFHEAMNNLGNALVGQGLADEAIMWLTHAVQLKPDAADYHHNLASAFRAAGDLDRAAEQYRRALSLQPNLVPSIHGLGNVSCEAGDLDQALECYRKALALSPASHDIHSALLYSMHFQPGVSAQQILAEARRWNQMHAAPLAREIQPHDNDAIPDRRLRIGYVSPDFRAHAVGRFILPLLQHHDSAQFEIICYSNTARPDSTTARLKAFAHHWRDIAGISDEQVCQMTRADRIDILIDLAMHTDGNRLLVFARKPAPVQATYLAYCSTTGLDAIDYRLSDPYLDPPGFDDRRYCEKTMRLASSFWCYAAPDDAPDVSSSQRDRPITFGCLNNFCKISESVLACWTEILRTLPDSRLVLHAHPGAHRQKLGDRMAAAGIDPNRMEFIGFLPMRAYLERYRTIDIALDTFPYAGGTTSCDALWMGVPVVTFAGATAVGRGGASILANIGLPDLIAPTTADYIRIAIDLANDRARLAELRATLRDRMRASPLMNAAQCTLDIESANRTMWQEWCAR